MEYKLSQAFMEHTEFYEGVRSLLIMKDKNPNWKYKKVDDVTQSEINSFFDRNESLNLNISYY